MNKEQYEKASWVMESIAFLNSRLGESKKVENENFFSSLESETEAFSERELLKITEAFDPNFALHSYFMPSVSRCAQYSEFSIPITIYKEIREMCQKEWERLLKIAEEELEKI